MDYESDTRLAYRADKAKSYKRQQTRGITWARFSTWREKLYVARSLKYCNLTEAGRILDIPCGTGILGNVLCKHPSFVIAIDISREMMDLAREDYRGANFGGFIQADITKPPFREGTFNCVITLGLMHRLPQDIRNQAFKKIAFLSNRFIIISYSMDSSFQQLKQWLIKKLLPSHQSAPSPVPMTEIMKELKTNRLRVKRKFKVMPFLSAEVVFLLVKDTG